jgi:hypothetical protein
VRDAVHGARHAALGTALKASHPVAYARGARAELQAIVSVPDILAGAST